MQVPLEDIIIKERVRTDMGDLAPLMESMRLHGQLNPVTLSRENELIAGHRRTLAARELGWKYIEAHIVERTSEVEKLQLELEENVHRKDFSPEELLAGYKRLDQLMHPSLPRRIGTAIRSFFGKLFRRRKKAPSPPVATTSNETPPPKTPTPTEKTDQPEEPNKKEHKIDAESDVIGSQFGV